MRLCYDTIATKGNDRPWVKSTRLIVGLTLAALGSAVPGCSMPPRSGGDFVLGSPGAAREANAGRQPAAGHGGAVYSPEGAKASRAKPELYPGTGRFVAARGRAPASVSTDSAGGITLNFKDADIQDAVKAVLGDVLKANYTVDPQVKGQVSLQTSRPIARADLIPTLEILLRANGAVLRKDGELYRVVPDGSALNGAVATSRQIGRGVGYRVVVVPLRYIAAKEMQKLLELAKPAKGVLHADPARNLLVISGSETELRNMLDTVSVFDVDQMRGMSVGMFPLHAVEARVVSEELGKMYGEGAGGLLSGMLKLVPVERLNALLVISPQKKYLEQAGTWIERLDRTGDVAGTGLFVYYVQNGKAGRLAEMLTQIFTEAPGPVRAAATAAKPVPGAKDIPAGKQGASGPMPSPGPGPAALRDIAADVGAVRIIADEENNALLVMSSPSDYKKIEQAIRKLDIIPQQVLVEASIIEVALTGDLSYGVEWYFRSKANGYSGVGTLDLGKSGLAPVVPGFSYQVLNSAGAIRGVLNALASETELRVVSSPSLMVLDNRTARIRVGDQVPVRTSETTNTATSGTNPLIVSTIQFRDTGVLLEVTPRVNTGGLVVLDISQEVSNVDKTTSSSIDSPTINQRQISTSVAVQSGETIVLGGLIRRNNSDSSSGVPGLRDIPLLGWLFGGSSRSRERTELLVLITPTAVPDQHVARQVTDELRNKMKVLFRSDERAPPQPDPAADGAASRE